MPDHLGVKSMVLGNLLLEVLTDTLSALKQVTALVDGIPVKLTDGTPTPDSFKNLIKPIEKKLNAILSNKHFVEKN